jgi:hypothetical protein
LKFVRSSLGGKKSRINDRWLEPSKGRQKGKAKERSKMNNSKEGKEGERERASPSYSRKLFHPWPF